MEQGSDRWWPYAMVSGQVLMAASTFFWNQDGSYSVNASAMMVLSMLGWATGFAGVFGSLAQRLPFYSKLGLIYAHYGCIGGVAFAMEGVFSLVFRDDKAGLTAFELYPLQMNLILYWSGPAFPLTLLVLGLVIYFKRMHGRWPGVLIALGGAAFPASRIPRVALLAHGADVLLLAGVVALAWMTLNNNRQVKEAKDR